MERYAHDLQEALVSGRLVASGSVELTDGLVVNLERMVRITPADFERRYTRKLWTGSMKKAAYPSG